MAEWVLKVANARGEIHHHTVEAETGQELRDKYAQQGCLVCSVRRRGGVAALPTLSGRRPRLTAALSLIEPSIMIFMGAFVAFVLVALYLPIFSLAETLR